MKSILAVMAALFMGSSFQSATVAGGEVSPLGAIVNGSGFSVTHLETGRYEIRFDHKFAAACPVMTVTLVDYESSPPTAQVDQRRACSASFEVVIANPVTAQYLDRPFDFIAASTR
jgi:hypothetical protein